MDKKRMARLDGERIVTLEVKMADFEKKLDSVSTKIDTLIVMSQVQTSIEERMKKLEVSSNLWRFLSPTLSAILATVATFLVIFFLQHQ